MIYLSPPDVADEDRRRLLDAFDRGWIATTGSELGAFEADFTHTTSAGGMLVSSCCPEIDHSQRDLHRP